MKRSALISRIVILSISSPAETLIEIALLPSFRGTRSPELSEPVSRSWGGAGSIGRGGPAAGSFEPVSTFVGA